MSGLQAMDVGDGLYVEIGPLDGGGLMVDCGSSQGWGAAGGRFVRRCCDEPYPGPTAFVLSHFHRDHYNGLQWAAGPGLRRWSRRCQGPRGIYQVYYPRLPDLPEPGQRDEFLACQLAMDARVLGSGSGVPPHDLLAVISTLNSHSDWGPARMEYRAVCEGDTISVWDSQFEVLFPPRRLAEGSTVASVTNAIESFNDAMEKDPETRKAYDTVRERGTDRLYLEDKGFIECPHAEEETDARYLRAEEPRELPEPVQTANDALRRAANRLGMAMHDGNRLLFMGDAQGREIERIVQLLEDAKRLNFGTLIAPHHGTHWHDSMKKLRIGLAICSSGPLMGPRMVPGLKQIAETCAATWVNGDIVAPMSGSELWRDRRHHFDWPWWAE